MRKDPEIVVVGGGVASFAAGIHLRKLLPRARLRILTDARPHLLGGHLASWDEGGFAVEHGFHVLFGFYEEARKLLREAGGMDNFRRSPMHVHVHRDGAIHRLPILNQLSYPGFTHRERLRMAPVHVRGGLMAAQALWRGPQFYERFDGLDLREWARRAGVPASVIGATYFEQFYAAAFNDPHELSALVGLQSLHGCGIKPWHYYFRKPSREALIVPLLEHFVQRCGGEVSYEHQLVALTPDPERPERIGRAIVNAAGRRTEIAADAFVLALGVEDFKRVDVGEAWARHSYFKSVHELESVVSVSLQAWFRHDPVPRHVDTFVSGMPRPFSVVCPLSRVRGQPAHPDYPHELIACGSEAEFASWTDEALIDKFVADLRRAGFDLRGDVRHGRDAHYVLRRNDAPAHRYLLTRPGQWHLRPTPRSPIANVALAGAWTRSTWALPCVETAVCSAKEAAAVVAADVATRASIPVWASARATARVEAYPVGALVLPPPYRFPDTTGRFFLLERAAGASDLAPLPSGLSRFAPLADKVLLAVFEHRRVRSDRDPTATEYDYLEVMLADAVAGPEGPGLRPLALYLDDPTAVAAGREVYGFPKKLAALTAGADGFSVARPGRRPEERAAGLEDIVLLRGTWRDGGDGDGMTREPISSALAGLARLAGRAPLGAAAPIYNHLRIFEADGSGRVAFERLTCARMRNLHVLRVRGLRDARLEVGASLHDPLDRVIARADGPLALGRGLRVDFAFDLGTRAREESLVATEPPRSAARSAQPRAATPSQDL